MSPEAMATRELVRELTSNTSLLIKRHLKLAELEGSRNLEKEKGSIKLLGAAAAVGYAAAILLLVAAALGIGAALDGRYWAGALIVGGILLLAAGILFPLGWSRRVKEPLRRTRRELNQELSWANAQLAT